MYFCDDMFKCYGFILILLYTACSNINIYKASHTEYIQWKNIPIFKDFISPWSEKSFGETTFQYQNDTSWFYFLFKVVDKDIQLCDTSLGDEQNALQSDRVELFFAKDSLMQPYYTFEMDAANRLFDAHCSIVSKNKTNPKQINADWDIDKKDFQFIASQTKNGYEVEGKLSMSFLKKEQLIKNNQLWCGMQRADFSAAGPTQWICAKDPKTNTPDFHCWGVFRKLTFGNEQ